MAYRFRGLGVVLEMKGFLDDYKKFAMNKLYHVNVLSNLALHLLFECFHYFDVPTFTMWMIRIMPFQEMKHIYGEKIKITHKCLLCKIAIKDVCLPILFPSTIIDG
jgi:hypothetical protein